MLELESGFARFRYDHYSENAKHNQKQDVEMRHGEDFSQRRKIPGKLHAARISDVEGSRIGS